MNKQLIDIAREGRLDALRYRRRTRSRAAMPIEVETTNIFDCSGFESFSDLSADVAFQTRRNRADVATTMTQRSH